MPDVGNGRASIQDAFVDVVFSPAFRIRTGKDKTPVGYEVLVRAARLVLLERSSASSLVPSRDVGLQVLGEMGGGAISYAAGVFNGVSDGTHATTVLDRDGHKDVAGRVAVRPFQRGAASRPSSAGLGMHIGFSTGRQGVRLPTLRTSWHQPYFSYAADATAGGRRTRVSPAISYYHRSFGAFAEYMRSSHGVVRRTEDTDVTNHGWNVTASHVLTGEAATTGILRPTRPFDPRRGSWGAVQIAARYAEVRVDRVAFDRDLASADASRGVQTIGIGANWYPTAYVRYGVTFDRTTFVAARADRRPAHTAVIVRCQMAF